ncbi:Hypothetical predicted protein [Olea europaea subsp. europaea]|uniref:Uncharacterized protein n=1 Tax=Olea europaea subsp. europaea TaxID=158383 RepID=A0A8S0R6A6_OLEEU|nr:Hypothetical predicted protein [Olea europaea subsp. europaea]
MVVNRRYRPRKSRPRQPTAKLAPRRASTSLGSPGRRDYVGSPLGKSKAKEE